MSQKDLRKVLGKVQKIHRGRTVSGMDFIFWVIPGVMLPLGLLAYGSYILANGYTQGVNAYPVARTWFLLAAFTLFPYGILALRRFASARQAVVRYANGLRFINIPGGHRTLLWRQIRGLRTTGTRYTLAGRPVSDRYRLTIDPFHGAPIEIPAHLQELPELAEAVIAAIHPLLIPAIEEEIRSDRTVEWGPIRIDRAHFSAGDAAIPWRAVRAIRVDSGQLVVEADGVRTLRFPARDVPNLELLLQVIDRYIDTPADTQPQPALGNAALQEGS